MSHDLAWKLAWVGNGWAGPGLLDTYRAEWRPVGIRRASRSAREDVAPGPEALAEDLNGRLTHAWVPATNGHPRSTQDLLGPGLTLLTGPDASVWTTAAATLDTPFPLTVHTLDPATADTLAITPDGATLIRPDAQPIVHWPTAPADPPATLAAVTTGWSNRQAAPVG